MKDANATEFTAKCPECKSVLGRLTGHYNVVDGKDLHRLGVDEARELVGKQARRAMQEKTAHRPSCSRGG